MSKLLDLSVKINHSRNNSNILPKSIRACIIGKSGCGKTCLLMNLLLNKFNDEEYLDYNSLFIFSKSLNQPVYEILIKGLEQNCSKKEILDCFIKQKFDFIKLTNKNNDVNNIKIQYCDNVNSVPDPSELDPKLKNLIIFDDIIDEKNQARVEKYFIRGRPLNIDCIYLSQDYFSLSKNLIRKNANFYILFEQSKEDLNLFRKAHIIDLNKEEFIKLCHECWKDDYGFITIDLSSKINYGKYRKMLNYFYINKI